jgi:tripartite motif-containing protein 71
MNSRVQVFTLDGQFLRCWGRYGSDAGRFNTPRGLAVSGGLAYVTDTWNHRVQVFNSADGAFVCNWGSEKRFKGQETAVAVAGGHVFVTDDLRNLVQVFTLEGKFVRSWGDSWWKKSSVEGQLSRPDAIAVSGELAYVVDWDNDRVQVFNARDGEFVRSWGSKGKGDGQFLSLGGIAVADELVYVIDRGNHRVQVFRC